MQLFITHHIQIYIPDQTILIYDQRVLYQCIQVLRYKPGQEIVVQNEGVRYTVVLHSRDKKQLYGSLQSKVMQILTDATVSPKKTLIVGMSNKREKMELIAQKSAELGVDNLIIWIAMRSIIQTISDHKITRLYTILTEASEQSRNRHIPTISVLDSIQKLPISYVAHQDGLYCYDSVYTNNSIHRLSSLIVGPEGGFDMKELSYMKSKDFPMISFGPSILRTETAAFIGARWLISK